MIKKLGIMQPYFMPYLGYFSLIKHTDLFILLDEVQFMRHGWIERNRILKQTGGWQYIAVPLQRHSQKIQIKDIQINNGIPWKRKMLDQLGYYKGAPYYWEVKKLLDIIFANDLQDISHLNQKCLKEVCKFLDIKTPIHIFSEMGLEIEIAKAADEWALSICNAIPDVTEYWNPPGGKNFFDTEKYKNNGLEIKFQQIELLEYKQKGETFIPGLSILDVMMFNGRDKIHEMLDKYYFI
jgi:hypothetical protein